MTGRDHERGLALIVVLWMIAGLSLIAGAMLAMSMTSAKIDHNAWAQLQVRTAADSAVQGAILSLFDLTQPAPLDGRARQSAVDGVSVTVAMQDQRGLVDLNRAGPGLLRSLFTASGIGPQAANQLVDRIVHWRAPAGAQLPDGASDVDDRAGSGNRPRHAPFQSADELAMVAGVTPEIYARIAPAVTVYSRRADFSMLTAPPEVLRVIPGMDQDRAVATAAARSAAFVRAGATIGIAVTAQRGLARFTRRAVVLLTGDVRRPYRILDWR